MDHKDGLLAQTIRALRKTCWILVRTILSVLLIAIRNLCVFVCYVLLRRRRLPAISNRILEEPAYQIAAKIRHGEITSQAVVKACIARIQEVNPILNAVVQERFEDALKEARAVDVKIAEGWLSVKRMEDETPFLGVPITIKESLAVQGFRHTVGMVARKDVIAPKDAEAVRLLRQAGAIVIGVTNLPECSMNIETTNKIYGQTRNPYDTRCSPGGSSGGEASIIAAAGSFMGIGSDFCGSVRIPSMFGGIYGHKPTGRAVSCEGLVPVPEGILSHMCCVGPLARTVADLRLGLSVLTESSLIKNRLKEKVDLKKLKVFYIDDEIDMLSFVPVHKDIWNAQKKVISYLRDNFGIEARKFNFPEISEIFFACAAYVRYHHPYSLLDEITDRKGRANLWLEILKTLCFRSTHSLIITGYCVGERIMDPMFVRFYPEMASFENKITTKFQQLLADDVVLIMPTFPVPAWYIPLGLFYQSSYIYSGLANFLGFPATAFPAGANSRGMPIGLQVMANKNNDHVSLAFAEEMEKAFGGWVPPS